MSRTIDEKVVEMRFDNSDFERNVSHSMSTLDKLKGALNFSGMEKAFDGITSAADRVSFDGIKSGLKQLEEEFPILGKIVDGVFLNMGRKIEDFVSNQLKSVTIEPIMEGFGKYGSKTNSVQMIMNATGKSIEEVSEQLDRLNWYTDETSYDFTEMVASIGKFTSAGIDLSESVTAMEGIANWAGISGATKEEANRAMYNISQALSGGFMRLQDWKSIENANMATKEFKEMVIQAAIARGTLEEAVDEAGNTIWGVSTKTGFNEVNYKTVASTLTEGKWLTNEVLTDTLAMYGQFTDELSKVYDDINETSEITTSQIIKLTNQWKDGTLDMSEAMAMTGKSAEELEAIFSNLGKDEFDLGRRAFAAAQEAKTFRDAIDATKDAVSTGWMNTFELLFGNYEEAKVLWTDLANELWDIFAGPISDINDTLTAWRNNKDLGDGRDDLIEGLKNIYRAARSVVDPITEAWEAIFPSATYRDIWDFTHRFREFTDGLIRSEEQIDRIRQTFEGFFWGIDKVKDAVGGLTGAFKEGFRSGGGIGGFIDGIAMAANQVGDLIFELTIGMSRVRGVLKDYREGNLLDSGVVEDILNQFPLAAKLVDTYEKLNGVYEKLSKTFGAVGKAFGKMFDVTMYFKDGVLTLDSYIDGVKTKFAAILELVTDAVHIWTGTDISKTIDNIRAILFDLFDGVKAFLESERWPDVKDAVIGIADAFKDTFGPAWQAAVAIFDDWIAGIRTLISGADGDFNDFFDTIVNGANWVADFVRSWKGGVEFISEFLTKFLSLTDAIEVYQANGGGILGVLAVINDKLRIILDTIADLIQNVTGFDVHGIGDSILSVIQGIGYAILQVADTISKAFGWADNPFGKLLGSINEGFGGGPEGKGFDISGIFDKIGEAFSRLGELVNKVAPGVSALLATVGDAFKNLWELIGQIRLEDLIRMFQGIASIMLMFQGKKTLAELGDTLEAYQKKLKADMLFAIAGSILMIAGAALMISKIDAEKIGLVLGTLGVSFAGLIGMMVASKWADPKALATLPGTVLAIAAAMVILAKAAEMMVAPIQAFANMENFWSGMGKLSTVMASFLVLLGILGGINIAGNGGAVLGAAKALGKLAGVLAVMLPIVLVYSKIDWMKFGDGLAKAALGIVAIGGALALVSEMEKRTTSISHEADFMSLAKSLLVLSAAIGVLTAVMFALTKLDWGEYVASLGKMLGILAVAAGGVWLFSKALTAFGETMFILDKTGAMKALDRFSTVLVKLGTALLMLTVGTLGLGLIAKLLGDSAQEIAEAGVGLIVTVLDAIVARTPEIAEDIVLFILGVLDAVADHTPEIVSACIRIIGGIAEGVKEAMTTGGIDIGELLGGGGLLAGILGIVFLLKKAKLGTKDFFNAGLALIGAAALLVEIGALFYGIGQLSALVGGPSGLEKFGEFSSALTSALMSNHGGMLILIVALLTIVTVLSVVIGKLELGEKDMASSLGKAFLVLAQLFGEVVGLIAELGTLFTAFGALSDLVGAPAKIAAFGELCSAIVDFFLGVDENGNPHAGVAVLVAACAGLLVLFDKLHLGAAGIGAFGSVIAIIAEVAGVIEAMGLIFALGGQINEWIEMIPGVGEGGIVKRIEDFGAMVAAIADVFGGLIGHLIGSFTGGFAGEAVEGTLKGLADGLAYINETCGGFFDTMSNMDPSVLEGCKNFGQMALSLGTATIIDAISTFISGEDRYKNFADGLATMGPGLKKFADSVEGINMEAVNDAAAAGQMLAEVGKALPNDGGAIAVFTGDNDFATFGKNIAAFGRGLAKYSLSVENVDTEAVIATVDSVSALAEVAKQLPNEGGLVAIFAGNNDFATFGTNLASFGLSLFTYAQYAVMINENIDDLRSVDEIVKSLGNTATVIDDVGSVKDISKFGENLEKFGSSLVTYSQTLSSEDFSLQVIRNTNNAIKSVIDTANAVAGEDGKGMPDIKDFGDKLKSFGSSFADYYKNVKDIDSTKVDSLSGAVNRMVKSFVGSEDTSLAGQVAKFTSDFLDKLSSAFGGSESKKKSEASADKFIDFFKDRFKSDTSVNKVSVSVSDMLSKAVGKDELKEGLKQSGIDLVGQLQNGITEAFEGEEGLIAKFTSFLNTLATGIATDGQDGSKKQYYDAGASLVGALRNGMVNEEAVSGFGTPPAKQLKEDFKGLLDSLIGMIVSEEMKGQFQRGGASLINSLVGGMKSVDIAKETGDIGKNATLGVGNGMVDEAAMAQVKKNAAYVMNTATTTMKNEAQEKSPSKLTALYGWYLDGGLSDGLIDGIPMVVSAVGSVVDETKEAFTKSAERGGFDIHSNSWLTTLFGRFLSGGFADGIIDGIPGVRDAIAKVRAAITDEMGLNDLMNLLHDNGLGALENTFADYVAQFGADFSLDETMSNFDIQGQMDEFQNEYLSNMNSFNSEYTSFMSDTSTDGMEALTASYSDSSYVADGVSTLMSNTSDAFGSYNEMMGTQGTEGTYSFYNNVGDSAMSAAESITPTVTSASQMVADAATAPIEEGIVEILSYVDWLKEAYPEGLTEAFSTPVFDFTELYENMGGGQLEAILNSFDALDETGRKNLIRAYGLGEQGGNEDLANYLTWYWKNEPVRLKNEEAIAQAQAGYQAYLEEQKALQEAQAIQSQQHYEGVQQIAGDMQAHTDEFNAKYMAAIEEIKMSVLSIQEELNGVHEDIAELNNMDVYIDSNALVGATADKYNEELGNMAKIGRRNVTR